MTKQEQIEEIKQVLIKTCKRCRPFEEDYMQSKYAEALYNYIKEQKAQVLKEFAEKVKENYFLFLGKEICSDVDAEYIGFIINELLKEYKE